MTKVIQYATTNLGKIDSLKAVLEPLGYRVTQRIMHLSEPQLDSVDQIAKHKVSEAYVSAQSPIVVQDSGFIIPSLGGFPGPYTKYVLETLGVPGILRAVGDLPRACMFQECLAYKDENQTKLFQTFIPGTLAFDLCGKEQKNQTSELWRVFVPSGQTKTIAEMSPAERDTWRHSRETDHYGIQLAAWLTSENATA